MININVTSQATAGGLRRLAFMIVGLCLCSIASPVFALESASYRLYDTFPNYGTGTPDTSASYSLNENGVTWYPLPLSSTNYLIVTAPPVIVSSSSSSSAAASSVSSAPSRPSGGHRGERVPPPLHPSAGRRSSSSLSSRASSRPAAEGSSSSASIVPPPPVPAPGAIGAPCRGTLRPSAPCTGDRCLCERPWSFGGMCLRVTRTHWWSWVGIICLLVELLLLFRIFRRPRTLPRRR